MSVSRDTNGFPLHSKYSYFVPDGGVNFTLVRGKNYNGVIVEKGNHLRWGGPTSQVHVSLAWSCLSLSHHSHPGWLVPSKLSK